MPSGAHGLDGVLRKLDPLLTPEQLQQNLDPFARPHPRIKTEVPRERPLQNSNLFADSKLFAPRQLDQPVALTLADLGDDLIRHLRRPATVHDQSRNAGRRTDGRPLQLDPDEGVAGEKRGPALDLATVADMKIADMRAVAFEPLQGEPIQRHRLAVRP